MIAVRSIAVLASILSVASAFAQQKLSPVFEVASVRLDGPEVHMTSISPRGELTFVAKGMSLRGYIARAYGVSAAQIEGVPKWDDSTSYSITAKPVGDKPLSDEQFMLALQQLLAERFHLVVHPMIEQVSGYALTVGKGQPKLEPGRAGRSDAIQSDNDGLEVYSITMERFCTVGLPFFVRAPVADATGITGSFHIKVQFNVHDNPNSSLPSIYTALEEQLGLKLVARKVPQKIIVVDQVDREPVEN